MALKLAGSYWFFGMLWILLSDGILRFFIHDPKRINEIQSYKGWFYIATTAILVYAFRLASARRLERIHEELLQSRRMETVGRMASGIVHDFNNSLSIILSSSELAKMKLDKEHPVVSDLDLINAGVTKGKTLVDQLLNYVRGEPAHPRSLALGPLVRDLVPLLRKLLPSTMQLELNDGSGAACIMADPARVEQALLNLVSNAVDAADLHDLTAKIKIELKVKGNELDMTVQDNGVGMSPEVRSRAFEPFYTTKAMGLGTGLGLASVYGMVKASQGTIELKSKPGKGDDF